MPGDEEVMVMVPVARFGGRGNHDPGGYGLKLFSHQNATVPCAANRGGSGRIGAARAGGPFSTL